ncbi:MAG TPA: hypothetical protein DCS05_05460 [Nitrospiraceae bacterium]|nr:hypothetical protein [Nitrospiraceae bacterium]
MSDIVERLKEIAKSISAWNLSDLTMRIPAEPDRDADLVVMRAAQEIEALRAQVAALTQERDSYCRQIIAFQSAWPGGCDEVQASIDGYKFELAAAQAHVQQLREALERVQGADLGTDDSETMAKALAIHSDTAALRQHDAKLLRDTAEHLRHEFSDFGDGETYYSVEYLLDEARKLEAASEVMKGRT